MMRAAIAFIALLAPATLVAAPDAGPTAAGGVPADAFPPENLPKVALEVRPAEVSVGEVARLLITIHRRVGDRVHMPPDASFGGLEVQGKDARKNEPSGGWVDETLEIRLVGFEPAEVEIPSQTLTVVDGEGRVAEVKTGPARVRVKSLIANEPEPKLKEDTGPGVPVFERDYTRLYVVLAVLGALAVAGLTLLGRWLWTRFRPRRPPPPPPPRPAEEIALEKLRLLETSDLLERGLHKDFHVLLSEAMREYMGNRYAFDSLELSTEELVRALGRVRIEPHVFNTILDFLSDTDLVKFAKYTPTVEESRRLLASAFHVVDVTTPKPQTPEPAATPPPKTGEGTHA